jgi:hypothetical protein
MMPYPVNRVAIGNSKLLTSESVDSPQNGRSLQADVERYSRAIPVAGGFAS